MEQKKTRNLFILLCMIAAAVLLILILYLYFFKKAPDPDFSVERWTSNEMIFTSTVDYDRPFYDVELSVVFQNMETGTELTIPCFWDGGSVWRARYALTEEGIWTYKTKCSDRMNQSLCNYAGVIDCRAYTGDLAIYQHGFVKAEQGTRYFTYDDGTPFFYLGDTHWHMAMEELDSGGDLCEDPSVDSRFQYTIDTRTAQGFTVIQSQPLGPWNGKSGDSFFAGIFEEFSEKLLLQFQLYDRYFAYIAEKGLVHANAQFSDPDYLGKYMQVLSDAELERLCRYWVARYSAYPVLWTMAQECDKDHYYERGDQTYFNTENNPWKKVAKYIYENDPYKHPITAHQEHSNYTRASDSVFRDVAGHSWFAVKHTWNLQDKIQYDVFRDYWENGQNKIAVLYESKYDHFRTGTTGARAQGWVAYLSGMYGYGYGSQKIWSANESPGIWSGDLRSCFNDGYDNMTVHEMDLSWMDSLKLPAAAQLGYMKDFFTSIAWWKLIPTHGSVLDFSKTGTANYVMARNGTEAAVLYFLNQTLDTGRVNLLEDCTYRVSWLNPSTGEKTISKKIWAEGGKLQLDNKPDEYDWVVLLEKIA